MSTVSTTAAESARLRSPEHWRRANRDFLRHALSALRHRLTLLALGLRADRASEPLAAHRHQVVSDEEFDRLTRIGGTPPAATASARAAELERARREEEGAMAAKEQALIAAGTPPPLTALATRFGLRDLARFALLAAAAPELDPAFARLYAYANDDAGCTWPTPHLLARVLPSDGELPPAPWDLFVEPAPLARWGLVRLGSEATGRGSLDGSNHGPALLEPLRVDRRVAAYLDGINRPDQAVAHLLAPVPLPPEADAHAELADRLAAWFADGEVNVGPVQLCGRPGCGRRALAALTSWRLGLSLHAVDLGRLPSGDEGRRLLGLVAREAALLPTALVVDASEAGSDVEGRDGLERVTAAVDAFPGPLFVAAREPLHLGRRGGRPAGPALEVPRLDGRERAVLLGAALGAASETDTLATAVAEVSEQFDLGPEGVAQAAEAARQEVRLAAGGPASVDAPALWRACRRLAGAEMNDLAQRIEPAAGWDDIILPADVVARLRELAAQVAQRAKVYGEWGFGPRLNRGRGIAALFAGPSGTGKTMAAEVLAGHLDLDLYRIDLAGVVSKYIGETERNLRRVFDAAEAGGAILFFDEADSLFGRRTEVKDSHDRYANIEIDYLLQRMEEYRGLAVLATNRKTDLDRAFLRRLRFLIEFPFPDAAARRRIWRLAFPPETPLDGLDYDALARLKLAGGNIRNVSLNAAFRAADADQAVGMGHLAVAVRAEYAKCEKAMSQTELAALKAADEAAG